METTLKQRLIGAAVIIALAVIFVPMILDGSGRQESVALNMEVPPEPTFTFDSKLPDPKALDELPPIAKSDPENVEPEVNDKNANHTDTEVEVEKKAVEVIKKTEVVPVKQAKVVEATENHIKTNPALSAWAVQVAAFGEKGKALALQEKLLASNLSVFTERSGNGDKSVYRVKVGPELKRENADKLRDKIEIEHGLKGSFVTKHP
ncbi:MAG: SPOR domain-containing protein [Gammaproteobacteria bacterium]